MLAGPPPRTPPGTIGRQGFKVSKRAGRYGDARFGSKAALLVASRFSLSHRAAPVPAGWPLVEMASLATGGRREWAISRRHQ